MLSVAASLAFSANIWKRTNLILVNNNNDAHSIWKELCLNRNYIGTVRHTSFCRHAAKASSSSMRSLPAKSSSSFSDFICCTNPNPMHLKGEPEPLDFEAFFSTLLDEEFWTRLERPSCLTCSTMVSNALNCFQVSELVALMEIVIKKKNKKKTKSHSCKSMPANVSLICEYLVVYLLLVFTSLCLCMQVQLRDVCLQLGNLFGK